MRDFEVDGDEDALERLHEAPVLMTLQRTGLSRWPSDVKLVLWTTGSEGVSCSDPSKVATPHRWCIHGWGVRGGSSRRLRLPRTVAQAFHQGETTQAGVASAALSDWRLNTTTCPP